MKRRVNCGTGIHDVRLCNNAACGVHCMIELSGLGLVAPDGCVVGVLTDDASTVTSPEAIRIGPGEAIPDEATRLILDHTFSRATALEKSRAMSLLHGLAKSGATVLLLSHDETMLERVADEIWVVAGGKLVDRGDPTEVLARYRESIAKQLRAEAGTALPLSPTMRKGDGRAAIRSIDLSSIVVQSGEEMTVRVAVDYLGDVADPVVGIMIRTRIGLNVYGTNTELEQLHFGPVGADSRARSRSASYVDLCPGDYTITAASHDPNGLWHEWLEDAVSFAVTDSRYTAGVANLRAAVSVA